MIFKDTWTGNWENAFLGLRHPMESYAKSDSEFGLENLEYIRDKEKIRVDGDLGEYVALGPNDLDLAQRMIKAGSPNDKFLRQIFVSVNITAPEYFWSQLDTYKVSTVANSTSKMHKLASTPITKDCFEMGDYNNMKVYDREPYNIDTYIDEVWEELIEVLETIRHRYLETKDPKYWKELIRLLPESWLQTRAWSANYAVLRNIIHWRTGHKLKYEWDSFIDWCKTLPYSSELLFYNNKIDN